MKASFSIGLLVACLLTAGGAKAQSPNSSAPPRYSSAASSIADIRKSIVRVVGRDDSGVYSYGSGVVVGTGGPDAPTYRYIATNAHVIAGILRDHRQLAVMAEDGAKAVPVRMDATENPIDFDLVFLESDGADFKAAPLPMAADLPQAGDPVRVLGFPGATDNSLAGLASQEATLGTGVVSNIKQANWSTAGGPPFDIVQHTAPINPGNSGGALIDDCGALIGINTRDSGHMTLNSAGGTISIPAASGIYFALSSVEVLRLAKHAGIAPTAVGGKCVSGAAPVVAPIPPVTPPMSVTTSSSDTTHHGPSAILFIVLIAGVAIALGAVALFLLKPSGASKGARSGPQRAAGPAAALPPPPSALVLSGRDGNGSPLQLRIEANALAQRSDGLLIGRAPPPSSLVVPDGRPRPIVSREHARFYFRDGGFSIQDAGSSNGAFVNGEDLRPSRTRALVNGDRVRLGDLDFAVEIS